MKYEEFLANQNLSPEAEELHLMYWSAFGDVGSLPMYQKYLLYEKHLKLKERIKLLNQ